MNQEQLLQKALRLLSQGKLSMARAICRKLIHSNPQDFNSVHLYGVALLKDGEPVAACEQLETASQLKAADKFRAQAFSNLSQARLQTGDQVAAMNAINQALRLFPDNAPFLLNRANLHERQQQWQQMQLDLQKALQLEPQLTDAKISMAVCLRQQGKAQQALTLLSAISDSQRDFDWLQEWALNLCLCGQSDSLLQFIDSIALDADSRFELAHYVSEAGACDAGIQLYHKGLELRPDDEPARYLLAAQAGQRQSRAPAAYISGLYDRHADEFEQRLLGRLGYDAPDRLASLLPNWLPGLPARILDLGCGTGLLGQALRQQFETAEITGVDLSQQMLQQARNKGCYQRLICDDILGFEPDSPFDLITASDVLIYLGDLKPLFIRLPHWLNDGGTFACTLELGEQLTPELTPSGRFRHSEAYLQQLAETQGLELLLSAGIPLRKEHGKMLQGQILLFRKP